MSDLAKQVIDSGPATPRPVEPHGIVVCSDNPEPHSLTGECVDPQPAEWTPGAGAALLRREQPHMVPDLTDEDRRMAGEIIASADPTQHLAAMFEDARAYCLARFNYSPESYVSPEARQRHIDNDARSTVEETRFAVPWNAGYARGISEGRRQAAPPDDVRTAAACISQDIRQAIDVLYGELAGEDDAPEDVEATDRAIARDMATVLDWLAAEQPETVERPEATCHRCHGPNIAWSAPSPLWNAVMRGGSINGDEDHDGIVCPVCFATLAEALGIADLWMFSAERVHVDLETVTPSGRVWDETTWLWREPTEQPEPVCDRPGCMVDHEHVEQPEDGTQ